MINKFFIGLIIFSLIILSGCGITGNFTAKLADDEIKNGDITILTINGKNTEDSAATFILKITPEAPNKVIVIYPGTLEYTLYPNEEIGDKIIKLQAFTEYTSTTYKILIELVNKENGKIIDKTVKQITVKK